MCLFLLNRSQIEKLRAMITTVTIHTPVHILPYLSPGRLVKVKEFGWAVVVNFHQRANATHKDEKKVSVTRDFIFLFLNTLSFFLSPNVLKELFVVLTGSEF
jgi:hypothetical protein